MARPGLSPKHQRFCDEYLVDGNGTRAYRAAYPTVKSDAVAASAGSTLLRNPKVAAYLEAKRAKAAAKAEVTRERVVAEYARLAFGDPRKVATWGPGGVDLRESSELTDDEAACVSEVSSVAGEHGTSVKFKLHDKKGALDSLSKVLGMFVDKVEHDLSPSLASLLAGAAKAKK